MTLGPFQHNLIYLSKVIGIYTGEGGSFWPQTTYGRLCLLALWGCKKELPLVPSEETLVDAIIAQDEGVLKRVGKVSDLYLIFLSFNTNFVSRSHTIF
jgi:hypothetical protein